MSLLCLTKKKKTQAVNMLGLYFSFDHYYHSSKMSCKISITQTDPHRCLCGQPSPLSHSRVVQGW